MSKSVAIHPAPAWREKADFIITADIAEDGLEREWEQLWARKLDNSQFEICCIPFFVYDLALGDVVEVGAKRGKQFVIKNVVRPSGRYTFRAWFGGTTMPDVRVEVEQELRAIGSLLEWYSKNLLAVDAADSDRAQLVANQLFSREQRGDLRYETGRSASGSER